MHNPLKVKDFQKTNLHPILHQDLNLHGFVVEKEAAGAGFGAGSGAG